MHRSSTVLLVVLLAACGDPPAPPPQKIPYAAPGVRLSVEQSSPACGPTGSYRAKVAWQVPAQRAGKLEVQVDARQRKHFVRSTQASGEQQTGEWVSSGLAFYLVDRNTDEVLAATAAGPGQCAQAAAEQPAAD